MKTPDANRTELGYELESELALVALRARAILEARINPPSEEDGERYYET